MYRNQDNQIARLGLYFNLPGYTLAKPHALMDSWV